MESQILSNRRNIGSEVNTSFRGISTEHKQDDQSEGELRFKAPIDTELSIEHENLQISIGQLDSVGSKEIEVSPQTRNLMI